ncbi:MAG: FtsX-like permease family protein [Anaeromyxobacter sp.]|nr:FtsX-like permease family protein [Anaeromyxobacter sp.]MBL0274626.1 FtsX-like permease family protein [Anaeromyxobacter sp.]
MRALDRKLLRDLWHLRVQAAAVALLTACGVATLVGSVTTWRALERTQAGYYADHRFPDLFAEVRRAPGGLAARLADLPGVAEVEPRVGAYGTLALERAAGAPITARLVSQPPGGSRLDRLHLRTGRGPAGPGEVAVGEGFAQAWGLGPGDALAAVVNGRRERLTVVGVAVSPSTVYAIRPGDVFPDDRHFAVLWVDQATLAAALDLTGAWNEVGLVLAPGASRPEVVAQVDRLLAAAGGTGAYGRDQHVSHRFLTDEIRQLKAMAAAVPSIFMGVAAYIISLVLSRLVATQRAQIGMLKAIGWSGAQVAGHYAWMVTGMALAGGLAGLGGGVAMGRWMAGVYAAYYRLPELRFEGDLPVLALAVALAVAAALLGAAGAVWRALRLPPAEAMRPAAPPTYRPGLVERLGLTRWLSQPGRMVVRGLSRRPLRAALAALGLSTAVAVLLLSNFSEGATSLILRRELEEAQRQDLSVTFANARGPEALAELRALPGVLAVEGTRDVPAVLRHGHLSYRTGLRGVEPDARLGRLVSADGQVVPVPPSGLVLSRQLAAILAVEPGGLVTAEITEGRRPVLTLPVVATVDDFLGAGATMARQALSASLGEGPLVTGARLATDPALAGEVRARLAARPGVMGATSRAATVAAVRVILDELVVTYMAVISLLAAGIAAGVVYNTARITWAEREPELSTLRVIGFTRGETWRILAGELLALLVAALPLGTALGALAVRSVAAAMSNDLFRIPAVVNRGEVAWAVGVTTAVTLAVTALAYRWVARLDLAGSLDRRE